MINYSPSTVNVSRKPKDSLIKGIRYMINYSLPAVSLKSKNSSVLPANKKTFNSHVSTLTSDSFVRSQQVKNIQSPVFKGNLETSFFELAKKVVPNENEILNLFAHLDFNFSEVEQETLKTPLHYAVEKRLKSVLQEIVERFSFTDVNDSCAPALSRDEFFNAKDIFGKTPLHYSGDTAAILMRNGADPLIMDNAGNIPSIYNPQVTEFYNQLHNSRETTDTLVNLAKKSTPSQPVTFSEPHVLPAESDASILTSVPSNTVSNNLPETTQRPMLMDAFEAVPEPSASVSNSIVPVPNTSSVSSATTVPVSTLSAEAAQNEIFPRNLDDVVGLENVKRELQKTVIDPLSSDVKTLLKSNGIDLNAGVLLHGSPGNGKTLIVKALANQLKLPFYEITDVRDLVESTNKAIAHFNATGESSIIFIDEIDAFLKKRQDNGGPDYVSSMVQALDKAHSNGLILIAATNKKDAIESAATRAGRFDKHIYVAPPTIKDRKAIIQTILKDKKLAEGLTEEEIEDIAKTMSGFSASATKYVSEESLRAAVLEGKTKVEADDFKSEIKKYSKEQNLAEINEENTTSVFDTEFKRENIIYPTGFRDVAGMSELIDELDRCVVNPLKPEMIAKFEQNGLSLLNGILLWGPPGNGKTYITEALSRELKLPMYKIDMASIGSSFKNETVKTLKRIFDQLETKYKETGELSVLFMDEIDAIMQKRTEIAGNSPKLEEINTVLQLMNNSSRKGIILVAATNLKDALDEAVLRPGRLDKHINVPAPDFEARKSIFNLVVKDKPIAQNITEQDTEGLAKIVNGFSASSIRYLSEETLRNALLDKKTAVSVDDFRQAIAKYSREQNMPDVNEENVTSIYDTILKRVIMSSDDPKSFADVGGMDDVKNELLESIIYPSRPEVRALLAANGLKMPNGVILYGPPGCGKTFIMKAVAAEAKLPMYFLNLADVGSSYIHDTSKQISDIFAQLRYKYEKTGEPSILFLDEMESITSERSSLSSGADHKREEINTLLNLLNNASSSGIIVVGATNDISIIDSAVKRTGRFDKHIFVGYPDLDARQDIINKILRNKAIASNIISSGEYVNKIATLTNGFSNSDITHILNSTVRQGLYTGKKELALTDFEVYIQKIKAEKQKEVSHGNGTAFTPLDTRSQGIRKEGA